MNFEVILDMGGVQLHEIKVGKISERMVLKRSMAFDMGFIYLEIRREGFRKKVVLTETIFFMRVVFRQEFYCLTFAHNTHAQTQTCKCAHTHTHNTHTHTHTHIFYFNTIKKSIKLGILNSLVHNIQSDDTIHKGGHCDANCS